MQKQIQNYKEKHDKTQEQARGHTVVTETRGQLMARSVAQSFARSISNAGASTLANSVGATMPSGSSRASVHDSGVNKLFRTSQGSSGLQRASLSNTETPNIRRRLISRINHSSQNQAEYQPKGQERAEITPPRHVTSQATQRNMRPMSSKKRSFLQPLAHDSAQHPKSLIRTANKAEVILQEGTLSSQQFNMMSGKANKKKRRILEPLTDTKAIDNLRKTDSAFLPSPTKLPSQKLLPLKNPIDMQDEGEICECEQPVVAKVPDAVSESQDGMQMMILARNKNQI